MTVADFGVSAQLKTIGGRANTFIGTPYWMAPEVIQCDPDNPASGNAAYTDKSDIWSIGITAIEIAEKNPPLSDIHPMQALKMIAKSDIGFAKPKNFSKPFVEFVMSCIIKNPDQRPTATMCLAHPFMVKASESPRQQILTELVTIAMNIREKKKAGLDITKEDEDGVSQVGPNVIHQTMKQAKATLAQIAAPGNFGTSKFSSSNSSEASVPSISDFPPIVNNVQEGISPILEPVTFTTLSEVLTGDFLDGQYILLGNERGLFYLDIQKPSLKVPVPLITDIRFRQIQVLADYNVLIALSGKHDHIRQYSLPSIRKLIMFIEGNSATLIAKSNTTVPLQQVKLGEQLVSDYDYLNESTDLDEDSLLEKWSNDYIKILNTKDTKSFKMEMTEGTAYLLILGQVITLFRWAQEPYTKFMKIKSFWVPESPKFVSIAQDGLDAVDLFVGYSSELNRVSIADSKVSELPVHKEMKVRTFSKTRWQNILQIPFTDAKLEQLLRESTRGNSTTGRKLAALSGPALQGRPKNTDKYFLGTYDKLTKVVDMKGQPMIGAGVGGWKDGVLWSETPVTQILRPLQSVISVGKNTIEIVDWTTAALRQRLTVESSSSFRVLASTHGHTLLVVDRKKKGSMLYWMRESSAPPRPVGSVLAQVVKENLPVNLLETPTSHVESSTQHLQRLNIAAAMPNEPGRTPSPVAKSPQNPDQGALRGVVSPAGSSRSRSPPPALVQDAVPPLPDLRRAETRNSSVSQDPRLAQPVSSPQSTKPLPDPVEARPDPRTDPRYTSSPMAAKPSPIPAMQRSFTQNSVSSSSTVDSRGVQRSATQGGYTVDHYGRVVSDPRVQQSPKYTQDPRYQQDSNYQQDPRYYQEYHYQQDPQYQQDPRYYQDGNYQLDTQYYESLQRQDARGNDPRDPRYQQMEDPRYQAQRQDSRQSQNSAGYQQDPRYYQQAGFVYHNDPAYQGYQVDPRYYQEQAGQPIHPQYQGYPRPLPQTPRNRTPSVPGNQQSSRPATPQSRFPDNIPRPEDPFRQNSTASPK